jgi:hypothetical protein
VENRFEKDYISVEDGKVPFSREKVSDLIHLHSRKGIKLELADFSHVCFPLRYTIAEFLLDFSIFHHKFHRFSGSGVCGKVSIAVRWHDSRGKLKRFRHDRKIESVCLDVCLRQLLQNFAIKFYRVLGNRKSLWLTQSIFVIQQRISLNPIGHRCHVPSLHPRT